MGFYLSRFQKKNKPVVFHQRWASRVIHFAFFSLADGEHEHVTAKPLNKENKEKKSKSLLFSVPIPETKTPNQIIIIHEQQRYSHTRLVVEQTVDDNNNGIYLSTASNGSRREVSDGSFVLFHTSDRSTPFELSISLICGRRSIYNFCRRLIYIYNPQIILPTSVTLIYER